ncbi:MAG TPA: sialate O-acetylesterase [Bacteroidia bacterium]|jgi:hypothetical protein|nr:sialate O-acetylesterase [Bacteroidia bacterium]
MKFYTVLKENYSITISLKVVISLTLGILLSMFASGQVTFASLPLDSALVARDVQTNLGTINIRGEVNNEKTPFDSISLKLYRGTQLVKKISEKLIFKQNIASFDMVCQIPAELMEYNISLYGTIRSNQMHIITIHALVAGDVYMIEGQSNAFAMMRDGGSANNNRSEFIRVFGNSDSNTAGFLKNLRWFVGQGDGGIKENGHVGQWGLRLGRLIVDSIKIPVAIFNGACGGTPIDYYECPTSRKGNHNSNYVRECYRLKMAGLKENVRAIIWSQGETDAELGTSTSKYISEFETLMKSWSIEFPGYKKIYIFQTKNENMYPLANLMAIEEAQRELAVKYSSIVEIIPTSTLKQDKSVLHFDYKDGYEIFGDRVYNLIARDLYGITHTNKIEAPMVTSAYMSDSLTLVVEENVNSLVCHNPTLPIQGYAVDNEGGAKIDTVITKGNKIIFLLSRYPGKSVAISCLPQYKQSDNWLTNTNGIEVVSFYKVAVYDSISKQSIAIKGRNQVKIRHGLFKKAPVISVNTNGKHFLKICDTKKKKTQWIVFSGKRIEIKSGSMAKGLYSIQVFDDEMKTIGATSVIIE